MMAKASPNMASSSVSLPSLAFPPSYFSAEKCKASSARSAAQSNLRHEIKRRIYSGRCASLLDDGGQGLGEYGLILSFVAIACVAAVVFLSGNIQGVISSIGSTI